MYTLNWQPPYDWSWMLGFLAARAVNGVETVADDYYARSLAVGEYRGVVTAIPDIARHTLHINLAVQNATGSGTPQRRTESAGKSPATSAVTKTANSLPVGA